jgi:ketosteroid isomerase-like protein
MTASPAVRHANAELLQRFYAAFEALDADSMQACYAADAHFQDEVFTLDGADRIGSMWRMLCDATKAGNRDVWRLEWSEVEADDDRGHVHWEAHYRFSTTGRRVHNVIDARFEFRDGRILRHLDRFSFWRWARQAFGAVGWVLGATPLLRRQVRARAAANLARARERGAKG